VPDKVNPPVLAVMVQLPVEGNPLRATVPEGRLQVGCVMVPMIGGDALLKFTTFVVLTLAEHPVMGVDHWNICTRHHAIYYCDRRRRS
jgi:hypothetical protein